MANYNRQLIANFGPAYSGLSTVGYTLPGGTRTTTGVSEIQAGTGSYTVLASITAGTQGNVKWDTGGATPAYAFEEINPGGATEYLDAAVSGIPVLVWSATTRTLSSFGTLVSDVATAVWGATTRTLSAFGFNVTVGGYTAGQDPASLVLATPANKLATNATGFVTTTNPGTTDLSGVPAAVWGFATRTLSAFGFSVTVGTNNDKSGYSLSQAFPTNFAALSINSSGLVTATNGGSGGSGITAADVWAYANRSLTDKAGFAPTAADNAQAVWSAQTRSLTQYGTVDLSGIPAAVWGYATRTLTSLDALSPIAGFFTNAPSGSGGSVDASSVWSYPYRSLTGVQADGTTAQGTDAGLRSVLRGDTVYFDVPVGLDLSEADQVWVTLKANPSDDPDSAAVLQVTKQGLVRIGGASPPSGATAVMSFPDVSTVRIALSAGASALLPIGKFYGDVQRKDNNGDFTPVTFSLRVRADVTRAV
jgi:hypothetical protein